MHLHAARGPPWRARVRPAGALGRPNQQEQHPKGPQATAQPEDRAGHPGFAAPQSGFYVAYTFQLKGLSEIVPTFETVFVLECHYAVSHPVTFCCDFVSGNRIVYVARPLVVS